MGLSSIRPHADDADGGAGQDFDFLHVVEQALRKLVPLTGLTSIWPAWSGFEKRFDQAFLQQVGQVARAFAAHLIFSANLDFVKAIEDVIC